MLAALKDMVNINYMNIPSFAAAFLLLLSFE